MSSLSQNMKGPVQELLTEVIIPGIPSPSKSEIIKVKKFKFFLNKTVFQNTILNSDFQF